MKFPRTKPHARVVFAVAVAVAGSRQLDIDSSLSHMVYVEPREASGAATRLGFTK